MTTPTPAPPKASSTLRLRQTVPAFRVFAGTDALTSIPRELARLGAGRAVIVTSPSMAAHARALGAVQEAVGERLAGTFTGVAPHSPVLVVAEVVELLEQVSADAVLAVGGGSAVVTGRAAVILQGERRSAREAGSPLPAAAALATRRGPDGRLVSPRVNAPKIPIWVVPSTPTTAYAKAGAALRDDETGERLALFDPAARAQGVFLDPAVALTSPSELVRSSALNALVGAMESLLVNDRNPLADAPLAQSLTMLAQWLPRLRDGDAADVRLNLMLAALLCGQGTDLVGGGLAQALAHAVGPRSKVGNGVVEAIMLPPAIRFAGIDDPARLIRIASALTDGTTRPATAAELADLVHDRLAHFGIPTRLREAGVDEAALPEAADHAMDDWALAQAPRRPSRAEVGRLLSDAW